MTARRLGRPLHPEAVAGRRLTVLWNGRELDAREGEPLAVTLLANGEPVISRSLRFHRPRGLMCSTGSCGWCECEVDGLPSVRSCRVPVREGLWARGEHAWPSVGSDLLGALDRANGLITPGFYHHRFLRPARFRKAYLDVIRWFGGRGRLRPGLRPGLGRAAPERMVDADVVVVGAGRAGLAAAIAAANVGARVVLVEADDEPGAARRWATHPDGSALEIRALIADAERLLGDGLLLRSTAVARDGDVLRVVGRTGLLAVRAPVVIAATGSYERPPFVHGGDRPGVIGARALERLIERWGVLPGERAALVGDDPSTARAGSVFEGAGGHVVARIREGRLTRIDGRGHVSRVRWADGGQAHSVAADLVIFGGRVPSLELPMLAGARLTWRGSALAPVLDETGRTTVPWLFVAGSATGPDLDEAASRARAEATGRAAASAAAARSDSGIAGAQTTPNRAPAPVPAGALEPARIAASAPADSHVCYCEDVRVHDVMRELAAGYDDPEMLKRRTGALTGPCQGKYCLDRFLGLCGAGPDGATAFTLPTGRPPLRPIRIADLAGPEGEA